MIDDLQWADAASLQLFSHLAARLPGGTAVIGALRDRAPAPGSDLARMLAAASRVPGHRRIRLGPLGLADVAELVRRETGQRSRAPTPRAASTPAPPATRSSSGSCPGSSVDGGLLTEDAAARAGVPSTVRDVVRDRMAGLDDGATDLLQIAALIGRDVDLGLLARAAGLDVQTCLDRLEPLEALGLLGPIARGPVLVPLRARPGPRVGRRDHAAAAGDPAAPARRRRARAHRLDDESVAERLASPPVGRRPARRPGPHRGRADARGPPRGGQVRVRGRRAAPGSAAQVARTAGLAELELSALSQLTAVVGMRVDVRRLGDRPAGAGRAAGP